MKKVFGKKFYFVVLFTVMFLALFQTSFVFAQKEGGTVGEALLGGVGTAINGASGEGSIFSITNLSSILLGLLLYMVLYSVLTEMELFKKVQYAAPIIAIIVAVISLLYFPEGFLEALVTNYVALGATILTVIPFLIALYFTIWVDKVNLIIARTIWGVFFVYYLIIFFSTPFNEEAAWWMYAGAFMISLALFIFIPFIREKFWDLKIDSDKEKLKAGKDKRIALDKSKEEEFEDYVGKKGFPV